MEWGTIDSDQVKDIMGGQPPRVPKYPVIRSSVPRATEVVAPAPTITPAQEL